MHYSLMASARCLHSVCDWRLTVAAEDRFGSVATAFTDSVTLTLTAGPPGALGGTTTVAAVGGVARFGDVRVSAASTVYRLTDSAAGAGPATSGTFTVAPAAAHLLFVAQPTIQRVGSPVQPRVVATVAPVDSLGSAVRSFPDTVTLRLVPHPSGSDTLCGPYRATLESSTGLATFSVPRPWMPGSGYRLIVRERGFAPDTSAPFDVAVQAPFATEPVIQPPDTVIAGSPFSVSFAAVDADGFPLADSTSVQLVLRQFTPATDWAELGPIAVATNTRGRATFSGLVVGTVGANYDLIAYVVGVAANGYYRLINSQSFSVISPP